MNEEERYRFDVQGYLVVKGAIPAQTVAEMNAFWDARAEADPAWASRKAYSGPGDILSWGKPFRDLLDNPRIVPYLTEMIGPKFRLDHDYSFHVEAGVGPLSLHGGGTPYDPAQYYHVYNGQMYNGLTVVTYALRAMPAGGGGFCCVPGSHKANFRLPAALRNLEAASDLIVQVPCEAGDALIFTEALTHGTMAWKNPYPRRSLFYKYSPAHLSWASKYYQQNDLISDVPSYFTELTEAQKHLLESPGIYHRFSGHKD